MIDLWTTLIPLAVVSAITPVQIAVVVLLLQSKAGLARGLAWVSGMTAVRLLQGIVFGLVLEVGAESTNDGGQGLVASALLLIVGVVFLVAGIRKLLRQPDEDAPPPKWMEAVRGAGSMQAFLMGAGYVGLSPKLWAFTLAAIAAIEAAALTPATAIGVFIAFVVLAQSTHIVAIASTALVPDRAIPALAGVSDLLQRWDRPIMVTLSLVFGAVLLGKALTGIGAM